MIKSQRQIMCGSNFYESDVIKHIFTQIHYTSSYQANARSGLSPEITDSNSNILSNEIINSNYNAWIEINHFYLEIT